MIDRDPLGELLRAALPASGEEPSARDLWPRVTERLDAPRQWTWFDVGLTAIVAAILLLMFPEGFWLLAYHL